MDLRRSIYLLSTPTLITIIIVSFISEITHITQPIFFALPLLPYAIFITALVLAFIFNNNREFMILVLLCLSYWVISQLMFKENTLLNITQREQLTNYVTFLLPLNFVIFSLTKERGILSRYGQKQLAIVVAQIIIIALLLRFPVSSISTIFNAEYLSILNHRAVYIPQISIISFEFSLLVLASLIIHQPSVRLGGFFASLIFLFLSFLNIDNPDAFILFYTLVGSVLITSIILNSYTLAYHDELTGLASRRALKQYLMSLGPNYTLAMFDVDHFKKVNDTYGHDVGDQVLRKLAGHLRSAPGGAKAYRYGGEEFTLVYNGKTAAEAADYANQLRKQIEQDSFNIRNTDERPKRSAKHKKRTRSKRKKTVPKNLRYTVSIGLAEHQEQHKTPFDTLKKADKALYAAKQKGRNCVVIAKQKN